MLATDGNISSDELMGVVSHTPSPNIMTRRQFSNMVSIHTPKLLPAHIHTIEYKPSHVFPPTHCSTHLTHSPAHTLQSSGDVVSNLIALSRVHSKTRSQSNTLTQVISSVAPLSSHAHSTLAPPTSHTHATTPTHSRQSLAA